MTKIVKVMDEATIEGRKAAKRKVLDSAHEYLRHHSLDQAWANKIVRAAEPDPRRAMSLLLDKNSQNQERPEIAPNAVAEIGKRFEKFRDHAIELLIMLDRKEAAVALASLLSHYKERIDHVIPKIQNDTGFPRLFAEHNSSYYKRTEDNRFCKLEYLACVSELENYTAQVIPVLEKFNSHAAMSQLGAILSRSETHGGAAWEALISTASGYAALAIQEAYKKGKNKATFVQTIDAITRIGAPNTVALIGNMIDNKMPTSADRTYTIKALKEIGSDDAIERIGNIGLDDFSNRLNALQALDEIRLKATEDIIDDTAALDATTKLLLDETMSLGMIAELSEDGISYFRDAFARADARKLSPSPYSETFGRAVANIAERRQLRVELSNYSPPNRALD
jgi:hypothetical protein